MAFEYSRKEELHGSHCKSKARNKLSEENMQKGKPGPKLGLLMPNSQVMNAKEKFLEEINSVIPGNT